MRSRFFNGMRQLRRIMDQKQREKLARDFETQGFAIVENFLTDEQVEALRGESSRLVKEEWPKEGEDVVLFGLGFHSKTLYFLESGDKIRYFAEKKAFDLEKNELTVPRDQSVSKIGHALHALNPIFKKVTCDQKVKDVFKAINFQEPTVAQSMVIFKNPKVGGAYTPHQDATFLYTEPTHLAGIWLALDDATEENGCLEFIPESHNYPLARRWIRKDEKSDDDEYLEWTAPVQEYESSEFVKTPVRRGDMVLIHGLVVHRSAPNESDKARWVYTFHVYDKSKAVYSEKNWLQPGSNDTFMSLEDN